MATPSCCSYYHYLQLTGNDWKSVNLVKLLELHTASECQHHPPLKELILSGSSEQHGETLTPLLFSIKQGDLAAIKILIEDWGVDINAAHVGVFSKDQQMTYTSQTFTNVTPLFVASLYKHYDIVRYLVEHGADISTGATVILVDGSSTPFTPLHAAYLLLDHKNADSVHSVRQDIIKFLEESGADPSVLAANIPFLTMMTVADLLAAQENLGIPPIMYAAIDARYLNLLNDLLETEGISTKNKIDALEVAAASFLKNGMPTNDSHLSIAIDYLMRARNLRTQQNLTLAPSQTPRD